MPPEPALQQCLRNESANDPQHGRHDRGHGDDLTDPESERPLQQVEAAVADLADDAELHLREVLPQPSLDVSEIIAQPYLELAHLVAQGRFAVRNLDTQTGSDFGQATLEAFRRQTQHVVCPVMLRDVEHVKQSARRLSAKAFAQLDGHCSGVHVDILSRPPRRRCHRLELESIGPAPDATSEFQTENAKEGQFSFRDGVLEMESGRGWLRAPRLYSDFSLSLEFRTQDDRAAADLVLRALAPERSVAATSKRLFRLS
jgi:hypothetical protein